LSKELAADEVESAWELLRQNKTEQALTLFRRQHAREKPPSHKRGLGEALMWCGQYKEAAAYYEKSIEVTKRFRMRSEGDYAHLGSALWCLGEHESAVKRWKDGVNAPYAVGGVCTQTPLLLFVASVLEPRIFRQSEAEELLKKKIRNPRIGSRAEHWPVTLGEYVLGTVPKEAMAAYWIRTTPYYEVMLESNRPWLTEFYEAILSLGGGGSVTEFRMLMRHRTQKSIFSEWTLDDWMHLIWAPEFYIARYESSQTTG